MNDTSTEINIFRTAQDCRGEPCDAKRTIEGVNSLILCQCLKSDEVSKDLTDKFTDIAVQTAEVVATVGQELKDTYTDAFNKSSYQNYKVWLSSVIIIFAGLTAFVLVALFFESTLISSLSVKFVSKFSVEITVHEKLKEMTNSKNNGQGNVKSVIELQNHNRSSSGSDSLGSTDGTSSNKDSQKVVKKIREAFQDDLSIQKACQNQKPEPFTNTRLLEIVFLTNHFLLSIFTSNS